MRKAAAFFFILLTGCIDNTKVPSGIIQRPKMQKILWEMVEADRFATSFIQPRKDSLNRNKKETIELYDKVFSYNGITRDEFLKSYKFYLGRPDLLKMMFDSISAQAERKRSEIYNHPKPADRRKEDSLQHRVDSIRNHRSDSLMIRQLDSLKRHQSAKKNHHFSIIPKTDSTRKKLLQKPLPRES